MAAAPRSWFHPLLLVSCLLIGGHAFAADSDGDGVDDSVDAFPSDPCGTTDTDGDGKPNELTCIAFYDGFDGVHIGPAWESLLAGGPFSNAYQGKGQSIPSGGPFCSFHGYVGFTITLPAGGILKFHHKGNTGALTVNSANYALPSSVTLWRAYTLVLSAGANTIRVSPSSSGGNSCPYIDIDEFYIQTAASSLAWDYDDDGDGLLDVNDVFPDDTDNDHIRNAADKDDDNDGVPDEVDNCPLTLGRNADQTDTDADGKGNLCDTDDDNDGVSDVSDKFPLNPAASSDTDNDGFPNSWRPTCDATCQANSGLTLDNCPSTSNADQLNTDGDAQGDACDADDDNDGIPDISDPNPALFVDTDADGIHDDVDADDDNDGVPDVSDAFPLDASESADTDGDGVGNNADNCDAVSNTDQLDSDDNGIGDVCDMDDDGTVKSEKRGSALAFGDFDNDGFDDLVIGIPLADVVIAGKKHKDAGRIEIYSGATGELLRTFTGTEAKQQFGYALTVAPDMNSDGVPDIIVGNPFFDTTQGLLDKMVVAQKDIGRVELYSGSDGALLQVIAAGSASGDHFGAAVAIGNGNLIVGSPWADLPLLKDAGYITVFNGISNTILYVRSGTQTKQFFGAALAFDDVNDHLLIGSPGFDVLLPVKRTDAGQVDIFDGNTGATAALFSINGNAAGNRFGSSVASFSADIGGTTDVDWAVGSPGADIVDPVTLKPRKDIGMVQVFSGLTATVQVQIDGEKAGDNFSAALAANGDLNNDGTPDIAIGAPLADVLQNTTLIKDAGMVEVFAGNALY